MEEAIAYRKGLCEEYDRQLRNIPGIKMFETRQEVERNYGYYPILIERDYPLSRDELYEQLKEQGIHTRKYFYPLTSDQACFKNKYRSVKLGCARELAKNVLVLPVYDKMETEALMYVIESIKSNYLK